MIACNHLAIFFIFFNLNGSMKDFVFFFTNFVDIFYDLFGIFWSNMTGHNKFSSSQTPAMEIMDFINQFQFLNFVVKFDSIYFFRRGLHNNANTFNENWNSGNHNENWENKCANRVCNLPFRSAFNNDGTADNSDTLYHIS